MNQISRTFTLEDMNRFRTEYGEDYILDMVAQGYILEPSTSIQLLQYQYDYNQHSQHNSQNNQSLAKTQSLVTTEMSTSTKIILGIGVVVLAGYLYFKWWLPTRYGLEAQAAKKAGVGYSAVGLTGAGKGY